MTLNKLRSITQGSDVMEKDHAEWINYPCSVAELQKSAEIVLQSKQLQPSFKVLKGNPKFMHQTWKNDELKESSELVEQDS